MNIFYNCTLCPPLELILPAIYNQVCSILLSADELDEQNMMKLIPSVKAFAYDAS